MSELQVYDVTCEYRKNHLGLDVRRPRFSWKIKSNFRGTIQVAYQLQISWQEDFTKLHWDTGYRESEQSLHVVYEGPELLSTTRYYYRIKVWDRVGRQSEWSDTTWWETAFLDIHEWKAQWITPNPNQLDPDADPVFLMRKEFHTQGKIQSARVYMSGLGLYEFYLNGTRVGEDLFAPGWTNYKKRIQYQIYDVTSLLTEQSNVVGVMVANGWYKGYLSTEGRRHLYGDSRKIILQLHIFYQDGALEVITTDETWKASTGPILFSELYHGETYDARLERKGWSESGYDESNWADVVVMDQPTSYLIAQENLSTRVTETIIPLAVLTTPAGETVLDMGQNMVGRIRFTVNAPAGTRITLKHAEVLDKNGNLYVDNLRLARQTVEYVAKGEGKESYAPIFSFQGFRYVQVEGYPHQESSILLNNFVGEVIHTNMSPTGEFDCSNQKVNQLQQNIRWGQRGNFLDVPTDCPQRDERLGWTGDAQVFIRTALFNYQGGAFFTKWLRDLQSEQLPNGGIPFVIPNVFNGDSSAAWGDAAVICPWTVYLYYGDMRLLEKQYPSIRAWVEYIRAQGEREEAWDTGFHFGDWLALDAKEGSFFGATPNALIATAFYAYSTRLLRDTAKVLNQTEDVHRYDELFHRILRYYNNEYITPLGRLAVSTQTAHILTLMFELAEGQAKERIAYDLNQLILENGYHLKTGFVGTPYLNHVLSRNGYHQTALKLLLQESYPSWLYPISKGATTIWEHWDGIKEDGSFWNEFMNSFNHYAYGAIGDWMYRVVAGLDMDETEPAYKRIRIQPHITGSLLTYARATYESMYGRIVSAWHLTSEQVTLEVEVPANTSAEIHLPHAQVEQVVENNQALSFSTAIDEITQTEQGVSLVVGSGHYRFVYPSEHFFTPVYSIDSQIIDLLAHEKTSKILESYIPGISDPYGHFARLKAEPLRKLIYEPSSNINLHILNQLVAELNARAKER